MSSIPPGDGTDRGSRPWIPDEPSSGGPGAPRASAGGAKPDEGTGSRKPKLVGTVVDPAVDDEFGMTGPGAPGVGSKGEHPVKARLLARARQARASSAPERTADAEPGMGSEPATPGVRAERAPASKPDQVQAESATPESEPEGAAPPSWSAPPSSDVPPAPQAAPRDPLPTPPPGAVASELEKIARRSSQGGGSGSTRLSPNLVAALGALLGLTVIGTVGILLGQFEPDRPTAVAQEDEPADKAEPEEAKKPAKPERKKVEGPWRIMDAKDDPSKKILGGKIGKQAFLRAIQDAGLPKAQAYRAYTALKTELDLDHCQSSDEFLALVEPNGKKLLAFEYIRSKEEVYQAKTGDNGLLQGQRLDLKVERNQVRRALVVGGDSFEESARAAGFDPGLSDVLEDAFRGHLLISELSPGDRLRVVAQEVTVLGEFARYAGIEAIEVLRQGKKPQRIYYYPHPIEGGYFDKDGRAPYEGGWRKPIPDAPVTSKFNMKRMHPVLNKVMPHTGTDFGAPAGTPIGATSPGTVSFRGPAGASGNLVKVKHHDGYESGYAHLSRFAEGLNVGDKVDRLQTVGYCGSTGRSTGPHLHFTMKKDGKFIDPESLNLDGMRVLPPSHRPQFAEVRQKYDPILDAIPVPDAVPAQALPKAEPSQLERPDEQTSDDENPMMADDDEPAEEPASAPPPVQPAAPQARGEPAKATKPSAIFMTDQELLELQSATDDGEIPP